MANNNDKLNIWQRIGLGLSGFAAPFLGDTQWGQRQAQLEFEKWKANKMYGGGMPLFTINPTTGQMIAIGNTGMQPPTSTPPSVPTPTPIPPADLSGFPQTRFGITGFDEYLRAKVGQLPESKMEQELYQKGLEGKISAESQVSAQELKEAEKKERDFRRVQLKLEQSTDLLARAYKKSMETAKGLGLPLKPERGIGGRVFGLYQKGLGKLGYNEFIKSFKGNLNETAIAMMRMLMPGRSERLVNLLKMTLPDLTGNPYEDVSQVAESMTAAFTEALAAGRTKEGKFVVERDEASRLRDEFRTIAYENIKTIFIKAGVLTSQQAATILPGVSSTKTDDTTILKKLNLDPNKYEIVR
ncbi:hypothetical protein AYK26_07740 [Euryarchaeota archaeon SM23-78]|nr:MAG: hypothetical protein AYK26_07740 [Euryarchaeota archaeon SM23-78]